MLQLFKFLCPSLYRVIYELGYSAGIDDGIKISNQVDCEFALQAVEESYCGDAMGYLNIAICPKCGSEDVDRDDEGYFCNHCISEAYNKDADTSPKVIGNIHL